MRRLSSRCQQFAGSFDHIALHGVAGEKFKAMPQAIAVTDKAAQLQGMFTSGQGEFQGGDFAGLEFAGERYSNAVRTEFNGSTPELEGRTRAKNLGRDTNIERITRKAAIGRSGRFIAHSLRLSSCLVGPPVSLISILTAAVTHLNGSAPAE